MEKFTFLRTYQYSLIGALFLGASLWSSASGAVAVDLHFETPGSAGLFAVQKGTIAQGASTLDYTFEPGSVLSSPSLEGSRNSIYNPPLEIWNTFFIVMENRSSASQVRLSFITKADQTYSAAKSKVFDLPAPGRKQGCFFNLSDLPQASGELLGFQLEPLGGEGTLLIDRISFEEEFKLEPLAGTITRCKATRKTFSVEGSLSAQYQGDFNRICLYETAMRNPTDDLSQLEKIWEAPLKGSQFHLKNIPLARGTNGMSRLSSQFLAVLENGNGKSLKVAPRFYIENWRDFEENPYAFKLPRRTVSATEFGARGDGFTDDTASLQAALDQLSASGGGRLTLPGTESDPYGRRYVVTHLRLRSNVELHLERGALLWQSQNPAEYPYTPTFGHDVVIPNVPWTHCMHVSNLPLLYGQSVRNVKITGPGKIRSHAPYCLYTPYEHYARHCEERIHVVPVAFWNSSNIELSDVEIVRANNYHTAFYSCQNVFLGNVKMHEVKCVSGDGMGLGMGTHHVKIVRVFLESNDDGVVLWSSYKDPRGRLWWWPQTFQDNSIHHITACHSYINSGGGKAIAIVPWGTDNPKMENQEIYDISVYDNVLEGGYSVGPWFDNPFHGRAPFDNAEEDDYSPVKRFNIRNNEYRSPCDLVCIEATSFISDCGLHSTSHFQNADFKLGRSYWSQEGQAGVKESQGFARRGGRLYEGLWLVKGRYTLGAELQGRGRLWVESLSGEELKGLKFSNDSWDSEEITFTIEEDSTYNLGITGREAQAKAFTLKQEP